MELGLPAARARTMRSIALLLAAAAPRAVTALCATPDACALVGAFMISVVLAPCSVSLSMFVFIYSKAIRSSVNPADMYPVLLAAAPSALNAAVLGWWTVNVGMVLADNDRWADLWWLFAVDATAFCLAAAATGVVASAIAATREDEETGVLLLARGILYAVTGS